MSKIKIHLSSIICILTLLGCNNESEVTAPDDATVPMTINSVAISNSETRSYSEYTDYIGVFASGGNGYTQRRNVLYYNIGDWESGTPIYLGNTDTYVCAYCPRGASDIGSSTDPTSVPITTKKYEKIEDLCYSTNVTLNKFNPSASFNMEHAYAKLTITVTNAESSDITVAKIRLTNARIQGQTTLDMTTGSYGSGTLKGNIEFTYPTTQISPGNSGKFSILIIPMTFTSDLKVTAISSDSQERYVTVSTKILKQLEAGKSYSIYMSIIQ